MKHRQIIGLDLLRLSAASAVMFYHFGFWHWTKGEPLRAIFPSWPSQDSTLHYGWVGVEVFFVLSGFVISYSADGISPYKFFKSRFLRLVPGVWVCATISLILISVLISRPTPTLLVDYISSITFWPLKSIDHVYWTLGIEISFYALVGVLIKIKRLAMLETLMMILGAVGGVFWVAALTSAAMLGPSAGSSTPWLHTLLFKVEGNRLLQLLLVQHGAFFAVGVVVQRALVDRLTPRRVVAIALLSLVCLLEIAGQNSIISRLGGWPLPLWPAQLTWLGAMGLLILAIVSNDYVADHMTRGQSVVRFLGRTTYPLYLIHNTIVFSVVTLFAKSLGLYSIVLGFAAAFLAAAAIEAWPETWLRRTLARRLFAPQGSGRALALEAKAEPRGGLNASLQGHVADPRSPGMRSS